MKKILFLAVATFTLATCAQTEGVNEIVSSQLLISPVLTRVTDTAFEDGDQIGVTITTSDGTAYATNVPLTYGSSVFSGSLTWYSDSGASTIVAYYPYDESGLPTSFTVASDQTSGLSASDFIAGTATGVTPSESAVAVNFKHQLSKILVNLDNSSASRVTAVKITGSALTADVDVATLTASVSSDSEVGDITAYEAIEDSLYSAIVVPQTVALGLSVTLASGTELTTELASTTLLQGGQYTVNATVEDENITVYLSSEVEDWTDDGEVGPGSDETDVNLSVSPTSVSVAAAGESFTVTVTCDTDYSVDVSDEWLTLNLDDAGMLVFTTEANTWENSRTGIITITAGEVSESVTVTQVGTDKIDDSDNGLEDSDYTYDLNGAINGYGYVDLGLSVVWAAYNIGADSPEDYGNYYAWGETEPKSTYTYASYILRNTNIYNVPGSQYDAATVNWGSTWHMPTTTEINELVNNCTWTWTTKNDVGGYEVTGSNGNNIFLPLAGHRYDSSFRSGTGEYLSASSTPFDDTCYRLYIYGGNFKVTSTRYYYWGYSFRPVSEYPTSLGLSVSPRILSVVAIGGTYTITVACSTDYSVGISDDWLELNSDSGGTLSFIASVNTFANTRTAVITVITEDAHLDVTVTQAGLDLSVSPTSVSLDVAGESFTITVTCDIDYSVYISDDWLKLSSNNGDELSFTAAVNTTSSSRVGTITFTAGDISSTVEVVQAGPYDATGTINGYGYVDLGLSVMWATYNVGASNPEDYGDYYAWGETETKSTYTFSNSATYGESIIGDISGNSKYDAARANWGKMWRMPTYEEIKELISECSWTWTTLNDVKGYKVTGSNGNNIFLPAAGYYSGASLYAAGSYGFYWISRPFYSSTSWAYGLGFSSTHYSTSYDKARYYGYSIRPVSE